MHFYFFTPDGRRHLQEKQTAVSENRSKGPFSLEKVSMHVLVLVFTPDRRCHRPRDIAFTLCSTRCGTWIWGLQSFLYFKNKNCFTLVWKLSEIIFLGTSYILGYIDACVRVITQATTRFVPWSTHGGAWFWGLQTFLYFKNENCFATTGINGYISSLHLFLCMISTMNILQ